MKKKIVLLATILIVSAGLASAQVGLRMFGADIDLNQNNLLDVNNLYEDDSTTSFFDLGCGDNEHVTSIASNGTVFCGSDSGDISQVNQGTGTKGGASSGSATIEFDCSEVATSDIGCSGNEEISVVDQWVDESGDTMTGSLTMDSTIFFDTATPNIGLDMGSHNVTDVRRVESATDESLHLASDGGDFIWTVDFIAGHLLAGGKNIQELNAVLFNSNNADITGNSADSLDINGVDGIASDQPAETSDLNIEADNSNNLILESNTQDVEIRADGDTHIFSSGALDLDASTDVEDVQFIEGETNNKLILGNNDVIMEAKSVSTSDYTIRSNDIITFDSDHDGTNSGCTIDNSANFNCDGSKNWIHDIGGGEEAVYSSQESPMVRAVYEGQVDVSGGRVNVSLPSHFSKTVSDSRPSLRVQVTPHELATVAVTDRSDSWLVIEADREVMVDYRVTGIREGYEDKKVIREKE